MTLELFDLEAAASSMRDEATQRALRRTVRQAISMSSVKNDLGRAREMMEQLKIVQSSVIQSNDEGEPIDRGVGATVQALFMQAVSLYVRATHTSGKGRNKLHIVDRLDSDMLSAHSRMTTLRDQYLAHFDDPANWEAARAVLALDINESKMALSFPHSRFYVRADDSANFDSLLSVVEVLSDDAYKSSSLRLNLLINRLIEDEPGFIALLRTHPFDPAEFFDAEEVGSYLAGVGTHDPDPPTSPRLVRPTKRA